MQPESTRPPTDGTELGDSLILALIINNKHSLPRSRKVYKRLTTSVITLTSSLDKGPPGDDVNKLTH